MKLHLVLLAALFCSSGAHATSPSKNLSKKSSRSDKQTLVAHKMGPAPNSNSVSESTKTNPAPHESNSNKVSENVETTFDSSEFPEPTLERQPVEAQVILSNVDTDDLNAEETMFFESSLRQAIQLAQDQEQGKEDEVTIGAILVENGHGTHKHDGRNLRKRELQYLFSIWAIVETFRCPYCPYYYNDDDYIDYHEEWKKRMAEYTPAPTSAPTRAWDDDDDALSWYNEQLQARNGDGRRHLGVSDSNTSLDNILCQLLREGPFERFHSVGKCVLGVSKW